MLASPETQHLAQQATATVRWCTPQVGHVVVIIQKSYQQFHPHLRRFSQIIVL
jgi:hypothetical protein